MQIYRQDYTSMTSRLNIYVVKNETKMKWKFRGNFTHSDINCYKTKFNKNFYVTNTVFIMIFNSKLNTRLLKDLRVHKPHLPYSYDETKKEQLQLSSVHVKTCLLVTSILMCNVTY
jgi:hypothetical protein